MAVPVRGRRTVLLGGLLVAVLLILAPAAHAQSYTVRTLHFDVIIGPAGAQRQCNVVGDIYRPSDATAAHPDPAVLTTNGFGGSKDDQATLGRELASSGYVVLSYSGLGFGGSGCPIELDDPAYDGLAASQLITFLGGGLAATDGTKVDYVVHDAVAHDGRRHAFDPRVGMIGGSYGGEIQFATAEQDPRLDTIIPIITWNDLTYSLAPNNANLPRTVPSHSVTADLPGVAKFIWLNAFFGEGAAVDGLKQLSVDPTADLTGCPNFNSQVCSAAVQTDTLGAPPQSAITLLRHASVESYASRIRIPTLLAQGENDTLFQLHEATTTYETLRRQGTPVKMIWQSWGHSQSKPAPGELGDGPGGYSAFDAHGGATYEGQTIGQWFAHYLKDDPAAPSLDFSFFRPWVSYAGNAASAYGRSASYPVGTPQNLELSGSNALVSQPSAVRSGQAAFATPGAGAPTSYSEISAVEMNVKPGMQPYDVPGSVAEFRTAPLARATDVVGIPSVEVRVSTPLGALGGAVDPAGATVLFFKLYDLTPSGAITLPDKLIAPVRITGGGGIVHVDLPGIVHRFPAGDRIALVVAGGDSAYRGNLLAEPVTISTNSSNPGVLHLPVADPSAYGPVVYATPPGLRPVPGCPLAGGRLHGRQLGPLLLGMTRARAHRALPRSRDRGRRDMDFFCLTPNGIRVGYLPSTLLRKLPRARRARLAGRAVLLLSAAPRYALAGVRPGTRVRVAARHLRLGRPFRVGLNVWYLASSGPARGVLKTRHGVVEEVGIADRTLTGNRRAATGFLRSFR